MIRRILATVIPVTLMLAYLVIYLKMVLTEVLYFHPKDIIHIIMQSSFMFLFIVACVLKEKYPRFFVFFHIATSGYFLVELIFLVLLTMFWMTNLLETLLLCLLVLIFFGIRNEPNLDPFWKKVLIVLLIILTCNNVYRNIYVTLTSGELRSTDLYYFTVEAFYGLPPLLELLLRPQVPEQKRTKRK